MSTNVVRGIDASVARVDMKFEAVVIPVSDVDRAKEFYGKLGWRLDADFRFDNGFRIVQFTPPGSGCSVQFGTNITSAAPGSAQGLYLVVSDIEAARNELVARAVEVSDVFHAGDAWRSVPARRHKRSRQRPSARSRHLRLLRHVQRPDGNGWLLQEVTTRLPGRVDPVATSFGSASDLASALRRAEAAHGEHEKRIGKADPNWPDWYAEYMVAEQAGRSYRRERLRPHCYRRR